MLRRFPLLTLLSQLSLFETGQSDFVVPIGLYITRLQQLEASLAAPSASLEIEVYYKEDEHEDSELQPFLGRIDNVDPSNIAEDSHISGSGYRSVSIVWEEGEYDRLSPWEINMRDMPPTFGRECLSPEEKRKIRDAINTIKDIEGVETLFVHPVDESIYTDYRSRIEVPMDLTFISSRLEAGYYSNILSVVADVKLIKDNCVKYNGDVHDASFLAKRILSKFEEMVVGDAFLEVYRQSQQEIERLASESGNSQATAASAAPVVNNSVPAVRRSSRQQTRSARSSLENLPPPRRDLRSRSASGPTAVGRSDRNSRRSGLRSVLESAQGRTLEDLSGSSRGRASQSSDGTHRSLRSAQPQPAGRRETRARSLGHTNRSNAQEASRRPGLRSSDAAIQRRDRREPVSYADQPSDIDESGDGLTSGSAVARRRSRGPAQRRNNASRAVTEARNSRPSRTRRAPGGPSAVQLDDEDANGFLDRPPERPSRSSTRTRARANSDVMEYKQEEEEDSEDESLEHEEEENSDVSPSPVRRATRARGIDPPEFPVARRSTRRNAAAQERPPESPVTRRSTRRNAAAQESTPESPVTRRPSRRNAAAQESTPESPVTRGRASRAQSSPSGASPDSGRSTRRSTRARAYSIESPPESSRGKRRRTQLSYEEPSSSEFESDGVAEDEESDEESPPPKRRNTGGRKAPAHPAKKRIKACDSPSPVDVPKPWPDIDVGKITIVAVDILERLVRSPCCTSAAVSQ